MDLRKLYTPVQPTVPQQGGLVRYEEFLPDTRLQSVIYCYWQLKTSQSLTEPFVYRVVADGCMDIFFELTKPQDNFVMGFCQQYTGFPLEKTFHYVGIRFLPTMFPQLFNVNAAELSNRLEHLAGVVPQTARFIRQHFAPEMSTPQIKAALDGYFLERMREIRFNEDKRLYGAIELIVSRSGTVNIETELDTGISPRQLRRLFAFYIGDSAKSFSKVVRFQRVLQSAPSRQCLRFNKLFYDTGYYDQAHFIKEFKHCYGVTPSQAFAG